MPRTKKRLKVTGQQAVKFNTTFEKVRQTVEKLVAPKPDDRVEDQHVGEAQILDDGEMVSRMFEMVIGEVTYNVQMTVRRNND